jgi:UDP-N-acetylmuramate: L-alanyl-gamma-D-glutamyl-meso-diaminopimelate ligase
MPKESFRLDLMKNLSHLKPNAKIYFIGISGVAMGQLAVALAKKNYEVSGSDKEFYEPMGSLLRSASIKLFEGYSEKNLSKDLDLVVIGNAVGYSNPEVQELEKLGLPYTCFPTLLFETVIKDKHSIVACGTHGKSTTTAMIAYCLTELNTNPSYFIGGVCDILPTSLMSGTGSFSVVEGDEYDDVFFSKKAKFFHYKPDTCIINAIEFDHADLYSDLNAIKKAFTDLVLGMPAGTKLLCCLDFSEIENLLPIWKESAKCQIITFGENSKSDIFISDRKAVGLGQVFTIKSKLLNNSVNIELSVPGDFNARNATAAFCACALNGLDYEITKKALKQYKPVRKRQEIRFSNDQVTLIEDFAHHPTAVTATLNAIKAAFPDKKLWAIFEPRSNTSRRAVFKDAYVKAFDNADFGIISEVEVRSIDAGQELLNVKDLAEEISKRKTKCITLNGADAICDYVLSNLTGNDVIVTMSNGSFGGIIQKFLDKLK